MTNVQTPYDTGKRFEPQVWQSLTPFHSLGLIERQVEEERFGLVDFDDEAGESVFTIYVERNEQGMPVVHINQLGDTPVAIEVHR